MEKLSYLSGYPYQGDLMGLPVKRVDEAAAWYSKTFNMTEIERSTEKPPTVVLERDALRIGFAVNGGDPTQDGAAILVSDIDLAKAELEANGIAIGEVQEDERDGRRYKAFFLVAPDCLCFYFHQLIQG